MSTNKRNPSYYTHRAPPLLRMDPKGNSLGRINTHSRRAIGNGSEVEGKRGGGGEGKRAKESRNVVVCVCPLGSTLATCRRIGKTKDRSREREGKRERVESGVSLTVNIGTMHRCLIIRSSNQSKRNEFSNSIDRYVVVYRYLERKFRSGSLSSSQRKKKKKKKNRFSCTNTRARSAKDTRARSAVERRKLAALGEIATSCI